MAGTVAVSDTDPPPDFRPTTWQIFITFTRMSMQGFGGVVPFAYRILVERLRWFTATDFGVVMSLGQLIPGPTICNIGLIVGHRFGGLRGALAALGGLLLAPAIVLVLIGIAYEHNNDLPLVRRALAGMSAVAAGMVLATGAKLAMAVVRGRRRWRLQLMLIVLAFLGISAFHIALPIMLATLVPLAVTIAWVQQGMDAAQQAHTTSASPANASLPAKTRVRETDGGKTPP